MVEEGGWGIGDGGELVGLELAEFLAERGRKVTVIEPTANAGRGLYLVRRMRLLAELRELGVSLIKSSADVVIDDRAVSYTNHRGQRRSVVAFARCLNEKHCISNRDGRRGTNRPAVPG